MPLGHFDAYREAGVTAAQLVSGLFRQFLAVDED